MTIYFAGGEDGDFTYLFGNFGANPGFTVNTNGNSFRAGYARYSLESIAGGGAPAPTLQAAMKAQATSAWFTARVWAQNYSDGGSPFMQICDPGGVPRILIQCYVGSNPTYFNVYKVDAAGNKTLLFLTTAGLVSTTAPGAANKIDIFCHYGTSGSVRMYIDGAAVDGGGYGGDVTTDGATEMAFLNLGNIGNSERTSWSEVIVSDQDTRTMGLCTLAPSGTGNSDQWTGAYSDVNQNTANQATPNNTNATAQLQQYAVNGLPSGTFEIAAVVVSAQVSRTSDSTPTSIAGNLRVEGTDHTASAAAVTAGAWQTFQTMYGPGETNAVTITQADIATLQIGVESAA